MIQHQSLLHLKGWWIQALVSKLAVSTKKKKGGVCWGAGQASHHSWGSGGRLLFTHLPREDECDELCIQPPPAVPRRNATAAELLKSPEIQPRVHPRCDTRWTPIRTQRLGQSSGRYIYSLRMVLSPSFYPCSCLSSPFSFFHPLLSPSCGFSLTPLITSVLYNHWCTWLMHSFTNYKSSYVDVFKLY